MMSGNLKILVAAFLFAGVFSSDQACDHLGFGQVRLYQELKLAEHVKTFTPTHTVFQREYSIGTSLSPENEPLRAGNVTQERHSLPALLTGSPVLAAPLAEPIEIDWRVLLNIEYKLKYFKELDMKMYAPVFSEAVTALHGKEVIIEGFVIPFDEEAEVLSLSFNPYASCFFCGKASPASIISMYLKNKRKRYKMDDFKKFKGTLYLNHDDPNEFYYILREAEEQK